MVGLDRHGSTDKGRHQRYLRGSVLATVYPPRSDFYTQSYHLQLSAPLKLSVAQQSLFLLQHSFDTSVFY